MPGLVGGNVVVDRVLKANFERSIHCATFSVFFPATSETELDCRAPEAEARCAVAEVRVLAQWLEIKDLGKVFN